MKEKIHIIPAPLAARPVFFHSISQIYDFLAGNNHPDLPHSQGGNLPHKFHLYLIKINLLSFSLILSIFKEKTVHTFMLAFSTPSCVFLHNMFFLPLESQEKNDHISSHPWGLPDRNNCAMVCGGLQNRKPSVD